jgi:hypothetical protein
MWTIHYSANYPADIHMSSEFSTGLPCLYRTYAAFTLFQLLKAFYIEWPNSLLTCTKQKTMIVEM